MFLIEVHAITTQLLNEIQPPLRSSISINLQLNDFNFNAGSDWSNFR